MRVAVLPLIAAINAYRRFVSPRKGFACPHRLLHGGASCSEHGLRVARQVGLVRFRPLMRRRFARCREAGRLLAKRKVLSYESKAERRRRRLEAKGQARQQTLCDAAWCEPFPLWLPSCDLGPADCGVADGAGAVDAGCGNVDCACDAPSCG